MKVYDFPYAPHPQKLRVYLAEKDLNIHKVTANIISGGNRALLRHPPLNTNP
jgi:glutathione S-transferase